MVTLGDLLILATLQGATMVRKMGGEILTFMALDCWQMHLRQLCTLRCSVKLTYILSPNL